MSTHQADSNAGPGSGSLRRPRRPSLKDLRDKPSPLASFGAPVGPDAADERAPGVHKQRRRRSATPDELAVVRAKRERDKAEVEAFVEREMTSLQNEQQLVVPRLHVVVCGSLLTGSALAMIEQWSEWSSQTRGTPWVSIDVQQVMRDICLHESQWLAARRELRESGLIQERRHYDLDKQAMVFEIAFMHEGFALALAEIREEMRQEGWRRKTITAAPL